MKKEHIAAAVVLIIAVVGIVDLTIKTIAAQQRVAATKQLTQKVADVYGGEDEYPAEIPNDAWGEALKVNVSVGSITNSCKVISSGPNKMFGDDDDIVATNVIFKPNAKKIGEITGRATGRFGIGVIKGVTEAVKEELKDD